MSQDLLTSWIPAMLAVAFVAALLIIATWINGRQLRRARRNLAEQTQELERARTQVRALAAGAAGLAGALARVEQQLRRIGDRQQALELRSPGEQVYDHALQLIRDGADAEELMNRCGLVRDEAELLLRMHRYRQTG